METTFTINKELSEQDSRVESYENRTAKVFTFEEMKKAVVETYEAKRNYKKRIPIH